MVAESGSRDEATAAEDEDEVRTRAEVEPDAGLSMVAERLFRQPLDPVQLSRYILLEPLGQGAFGAVYAAYDPELNRKVAIKLLVPRGKRASELTDARERFLREAQALAHFSHPNVVSIHDMGTYSLDASLHREVAPKVRAGVFLVMELVEGQRFDHWARARVRGWREILAPMIEAAQGLDAAHRAGLVHRDFKPANVLVDGEGHPKILDFGLARMRGEGAIESGRSSDTLSVSDSASSSPSMADLRESVDAGRLGDVITRTGTVVGTPRYMAPEQLLGRDAHPQSDQYAFCVTLYELLYGAPPFRGRKFDEQVQAKLRVAQLRPPTGTRVPPWLFRVVRQGLSAEPRDRFVDMDALRIALSRDPVRRRRRVALGVGAFAATIAVSAGVARQGGSVSPCESHAAELEGVWDDAVRGRVEEAFVATRLPHVDRSWRSVEGALDTWADDWARERTDLCEAGRKIDAPSSEEQARRLLCLERHRKRAAGLTRVLGSADAEVVAAAGLMAEALEDPTACTAASLAPTEPRPQDTEAAAAAEEAVAEANALLALHKTTDAAKAAHDAVDLAEALGGQHLRARARLVLAQVLLQDTRPDEARDEATAAIGAAERVGDDELACESMVVLLRALVESGNHDGANLVASLAQARAEATGVGDRVAAQLGYQLGVVRVRQARYSEAQPLLMHARLLRERSYGEDHPLVAVIDNALGVALSRDGRRDEAYDAFSRALDVFETVLGPEHPQLSKVHNNLGNYWRGAGRYDTAYREFRRAAEINALNYPADHPSHASMQYNLGLVASDQGRRHEALQHMAKAEQLRRVRFGDQHPSVLEIVAKRATILRHLGRPTDAEPLLRQVLGAQAVALGDDHQATLETAMNLAGLLESLGRDDDGLVLAERTLQRAEANMPGSEELGEWLVAIGRIYLTRGRTEDAARSCTRAVHLLRFDSGERSPLLTQAYILQSEVALARGELVEAEAVITKALELMTTLFGEGHGRLAWPLQQRAEVRRARDDDQGARSDLERAIRLAADYDGPPLQTARLRLELLTLLPAEHAARAQSLAQQIEVEVAAARSQGLDDGATGAEELERRLATWREGSGRSR